MKQIKRVLLLAAGGFALGLAVLGIVLPILPTTPWVLVAAYCFAKAEPRWERRMLEHKTFGPLIIAWRDRQAIPMVGKIAALLMLTISSVIGWLRLEWHYAWIPTLVALIVGPWIWTRPSR